MFPSAESRAISGLGVIIALIALFFSPRSVAQEQEKRPEYEAHVRLVELTLQAKGPDGRHVTDLRPEELTLIAGGREREIRVFQPFSVGLERFGHLRSIDLDYLTKAGDEETYPPRYYVLLFHQVRNHLGAFQRARDAAIHFVRENMLPNDYVGITLFDKKVDFELCFTNDKEEVLSVLAGMQLKHRNIKGHDTFYQYLRLLADRAAYIPHRVTIILIAEGMLGIGGTGNHDAYDRAIAALQAADVRVFGIDAGGLNLRDPGASVARFSTQVADKIRQSFNLGLYTQPTGGRYFRYHNNIAALFDKVDYEMSAYYILGFYLDEDERSEDSLSIRVECSRPGVRLLHKERFRPSKLEPFSK